MSEAFRAFRPKPMSQKCHGLKPVVPKMHSPASRGHFLAHKDKIPALANQKPVSDSLLQKTTGSHALAVLFLWLDVAVAAATG